MLTGNGQYISVKRFFQGFKNLKKVLTLRSILSRRQQELYRLTTTQVISMARKGGFYAVQNGRRQGVFSSWDECKEQVAGYGGARYKKFDTYAEAKAFSNGSCDSKSFDGYLHAAPKARSPSTRFAADRSGSSYVNKPKFYSVKSSNPNVPSRIFNDWGQCQQYVKGEKGLSFKKFEDESRAIDFMNGTTNPVIDFQLIGLSRNEFEAKYALPDEATEFSKTCRVYCDGSALANGTKSSSAGYGVYFEDEPENSISEPLIFGAQTNNRAEIQAVASALDKIWENLAVKADRKSYQIKTDSEYVAKLLNDRYSAYDGQELEKLPNNDLIVPLLKKFARVKQFYMVNKSSFSNNGSFTIEWVKGHAGEPGNEMADELARNGAARQLRD